MILSKQYEYYLPPELIAKQPAVPRDSSRLFVYDTKTNEIVFDRFYNLTKYLPLQSFLVMNDTKVIPARITMRRSPLRPTERGFEGHAPLRPDQSELRLGQGKVRVLFLVNELKNDQFSIFNNQSIVNDQVINKNTIRVFVDRKVSVGDKLFFDSQHFVTVINQQEHIFTVQFDFGIDKLFSLLEKRGTMPIPLYIKNTPLNRNELLQKYQTIFARVPVGTRLIGRSAAAPTASLHFTNRLFRKLEKKGIDKEFITLHIGMGTFAPVTDVNIKQKKLHEEYFEINNNTLQLINKLKQEGKRMVAVGTTVVRTLESLPNLSLRVPPKAGRGNPITNRTSYINGIALVVPLTGVLGLPRNDIVNKTDLFIQPGFKFQYVDSLITNFHLPGSSLMMLVESFLQHKTRHNTAPGVAKRSLIDLYKIAIKERFRFYSFGDGMLIK